MPSFSDHLLCVFGAALLPLSHTTCNREGSAHLNVVNCCTWTFQRPNRQRHVRVSNLLILCALVFVLHYPGTIYTDMKRGSIIHIHTISVSRKSFK